MTKLELRTLIMNYGYFRTEANTLDELHNYESELVNRLYELINYKCCCTELPTEKEKESKKLELLKWIQTDVNTEVNRTDWRSGFEYCYRWLRGDLKR